MTMNSMYFLYLFLGLLLLGSPCSAMEAEKKQDISANTSSRVSLIKLIKEFKSFDENNRANLVEKKQFLEELKKIPLIEESKSSYYKRQIAVLNINIKSTNDLLNYVKKYKQGQTSPEEVFTCLLEARMNYLNMRTNQLLVSGRNAISGKNISSIICTDPHTKEEHKSNPISLFAFQTAIDRYQFLNRALLCVYPDIDVFKLSNEGMALLRASVTLHPLLKGETKDLGHPDMAGGYGVLLKESKSLTSKFVNKTDQGINLDLYEIEKDIKNKELTASMSPAKVDLNYYKYHFLEQTTEHNYPLHQWNREQKYKMTPFDADIVSPILPLPELPWLFTRGKHTLDEIAQSFMPYIKPEAKKAKQPAHKKGKKKQATCMRFKGEPHSGKPTSHMLEREIETPKIAFSEVEPIEKNEEIPPLVETLPDAQLEEKPKIDHVSIKNASPKVKPPKKKVVVQMKKPQPQVSNRSVERLCDSLKTKDREIYEDIFSPKGKVSFKDFKNLWKSLGGELRSLGKGGSHRTLFYQGKKLGSTYRPHPEPIYGFKSKKYLRKALDNIEDANRQHIDTLKSTPISQ